MRTRDIAHFGLMVGALALAYALPFELLVLSYAILGPAHYLTEISWLHDRKFHLPHPALPALIAFAALGAMFIADPFWYGVLVATCFIASAILAAPLTRWQGLALFVVAALLLIGIGQMNLPFVMAGILLTTFVHVCVFTLVFMIVGAHRANSPAQYGLIGLYLASVAFILVLPPSSTPVFPALAAISKNYFASVAPAIGSVFGNPHLEYPGRVTGLLSFVYTYHYLNWFIKVDVIRWMDVPRPRLIAIVAASAAATGLYFYNYAWGFMVLLLLSLMHVMLEFPLNSVSIRQFAGIMRSGFALPVTRSRTSASRSGHQVSPSMHRAGGAHRR